MQPRTRSDTQSGQASARSDDVVARTRFDAGRACLNLLATIGRRGAAPVERLPTPQDFATWLVNAGLLDAPPPVGERELDEMRALRDAAYRIVDAAHTGHVPESRAVQVVNSWAARPTPAPQLNSDGTSATRESTEPVAASLAALARETIDLVTGPDLARVHTCAAAKCQMLFLDHSRGARRRWCSMSRCGNRAKARTHAAKTRDSN